MTKYLAIAAIAAAGLAGAYFWTGQESSLPTLGAADAQEAEVDTSQVVEMSLGNPDAAVTVVEYASFTCPHCRSFHEGAYKELKSEYIDTDKINFVFREVYFDRFGLWAGMVARCGGEEKYFGLVDLIFQNQSDWLGDGDPAGVADRLKRLGLTGGLTQEQVNACMSDADMAQAMVAVYQENAEQDNIQGTPSFMVNGDAVANSRFTPNFRDIIDDELGG